MMFIVRFTQCMKDEPASSGGDKANSMSEGHIVLDRTEQLVLCLCVRKQFEILKLQPPERQSQ
jgi:hypothetical protein